VKESIQAFDYAADICKAMKKGILLTTKSQGKVNTMTIGWGMLGIEWGKPIFIAYVRKSRHTRQLLDETGEFTVNIPLENAEADVLKICGTRSGRDLDKIAHLNLTLEESQVVNVPGIKEFPITLECKVIYRREQEFSLISEDLLDRYYPRHRTGTAPGSNRDCHVVYYGEIVNAYQIL